MTLLGHRSAPRVAIVGGGPAGAAVALTLVRQGLSASVFEAASAPQAKVGECLPPTSAPLLERLGLAARLAAGPHLRTYGNRSLWGAERAYERDFVCDMHGTGWQLERRAFEGMLARVAVESGVAWHVASRVTAVTWQVRQWELAVVTGGATTLIGADVLVDATGRRASLARRLGARRVCTDLLVGVAATLEPQGRGITDTFTLVETAPSGWWYSALLPRGQLAVVYLTDHDLPELSLARRADGWWDLLRQAEITWSRVCEHGYRLRQPPRVLPASSARLTAILGRRWIAVGDAAAAHDPLSAHGITTALGAGFYAAQAVLGLLEGHADAGPAYLSVMDRAYAHYLRELYACYAAEQRWAAHPFWSRRRQGPLIAYAPATDPGTWDWSAW